MSDLKSAIAFAAELGRNAKTALVSADGIGAELAPTLIGLRDDEAIGRIVFHHQESFLAELGLCGTLMRTGWGIDALVLMTESYGILDDEEESEDLNTHDLSRRFAAGDQAVVECLTLLGLGEGDDCGFMMLPYRVGLGRVVRFDTAHRYDFVEDGDSARVLSDAMQMGSASLEVESPDDRDEETLGWLLRFGMHAKLM